MQTFSSQIKLGASGHHKKPWYRGVDPGRPLTILPAPPPPHAWVLTSFSRSCRACCDGVKMGLELVEAKDEPGV